MASTGKQLICPLCEKVMASASWRFFTGLRITALDGSPLTPDGHDTLRSAPEISQAMRRTSGAWVTLA